MFSKKFIIAMLIYLIFCSIDIVIYHYEHYGLLLVGAVLVGVITAIGEEI